MGNFDLSQYETVDVRLKRFIEKNADARIYTNIESREGDIVIIKAWIYKNADEQSKGLFLSTGYAYEERGKGFVNATSHIENCETSAIGRALANLGMNGALRPSREEMQKAERMAGNAPKQSFEQNTAHDMPNSEKTQTAQTVQASGLEIVPIGHNKGKRWDSLPVTVIEQSIDFYETLVLKGGKFKEQNTQILNYIKSLI